MDIPNCYIAAKLRAPGLTGGLRSNMRALDDFFGGGLPRSCIVEWGAPLGRGGRELIAAFLASATSGSVSDPALWCLWVEGGREELRLYPPAWQARGVNLAHLCVVNCTAPVQQLKPVFLESFFKVIVLDTPPALSIGDLVFMAQRARANSQLILLLRPYFLRAECGNVWAKLRINAWQDRAEPQCFHLAAIRGLALKTQMITLAAPLERS